MGVHNACMGKTLVGELNNLLYFLDIHWLKFEFLICYLFHVPFGFWKHMVLNDLSYTQCFATLISQLGYEVSSSEVFCLLAKL